MTAVVRTSGGLITSIRVAWLNAGREVWTWRTDGAEPHRWRSAEEAQSWIDAVWIDDPKEKAKANWQVENGS